MGWLDMRDVCVPDETTSGYPFSDGRRLTTLIPMDGDDGVTGITICNDPSTGLYHQVPTAWLVAYPPTDESV